jgi:polyribonucleotide nucleotidyltransferase
MMAEKAIAIIKGLTTEPEVGEFYLGVVKRLAEFGAFVEILPGPTASVHISELDVKRVRAVEDICKEGDEMLVKVIGIDRATGKIRLSRKEALGKTPRSSTTSETRASQRSWSSASSGYAPPRSSPAT